MRELNLKLSNYKSDDLVSLIQFIDDNLESLIKKGIKINISMVKHTKGAPVQVSGEYIGQKLRNIKAVRTAINGLLNKTSQVDRMSAMESFQQDALADDDEYQGSNSDLLKKRADQVMSMKQAYNKVGFSPKSHISVEPAQSSKYEQERRPPPTPQKHNVDPDKLFGPITGKNKPVIDKVQGVDGDVLAGMSYQQGGDDDDLMSMMLGSRQDSEAMLGS
jgi:hypothetical protein